MRKTLTIALVVAFGLIGTCAFAGVAGQKICVDPGHGGSDPGAVGYVYEKEVNLAISLKFRDLLTLDGASQLMTRSTDIFVTLQGRCDIANNWGANRFMSVHNNASSDSTANGTETICHPSGSSTSFDLRNKVNPEIVAHMMTTNRGVKTYDFVVLRNTSMPAIMSESGFVTNPNDSAKLGYPTYQQEDARAHLHGLQSHYGETPHDVGTYDDIIIDNSSPKFTCTANWLTGTMSTDKYGSDYRYRSTAATSDLAMWTPDLPVDGSWTVYAWWTQGANRAPNASYYVVNTGGTTAVSVNQQVNGGQWNSLGSFNLGVSTGYPTRLSCWTTTGYVVIADAIKWHKN